MSTRSQPQAPDWRTPYVSIACRMGAHNRCTEAEPPAAQPAWPAVYEICSCPWCHPRQEGASMQSYSSTVSVTSTTVMPGDVIQVGGRPLRVADLVALPHRAKRLRFETGETLTMHIRTHLVAFRQKGRW